VRDLGRRVEHVAHRVTEEVERQHHGQDREAGEDSEPPGVEVLHRARDHRSPLRRRRLSTEAEEGETGEQQDRRTDVERRQHQHGTGDVREDVDEQRPQRRVPEQATGDHVVLAAQPEHDAARDTGVLRPRHHDRRDHRVEQRRAEGCCDHHREDDGRERHEQVGDAHQRLVDPAAEVAGERTDRACR
jgi:hypothetical protein